MRRYGNKKGVTKMNNYTHTHTQPSFSQLWSAT